MLDASKGWGSSAEPFRLETSRKGRWCDDIRNILPGDGGIHTNRYHEFRCACIPLSPAVAIQLNAPLYLRLDKSADDIRGGK
jgi:hypothetical protein